MPHFPRGRNQKGGISDPMRYYFVATINGPAAILVPINPGEEDFDTAGGTLEYLVRQSKDDDGWELVFRSNVRTEQTVENEHVEDAFREYYDIARVHLSSRWTTPGAHLSVMYHIPGLENALREMTEHLRQKLVQEKIDEGHSRDVADALVGKLNVKLNKGII